MKNSTITWEEYSWSAENWKRFSKWDEFLSTWWGNRERIQRARAERAIQLPRSLFQFFCLRDDTNGCVLLHGDTERTISRVEQASQARRDGVLVTGQSGIGKSYFLLYLLVVCLSNRRAVLFKSMDATYIFTGAGVWISSGYLTIRDIPHVKVDTPRSEHKDKRIWVLIDSGFVEEDPPASLFSSSITFAVYASPPNRKRYHGWEKHNFPLHVVMETWDVPDLERWEQLCSPLSSPLSQQKLIEAIAEAGPCPRDVYGLIIDKRQQNYWADSVIRCIWTSEDLRRYLLTVVTCSGAESSSDCIFAVHRAAEIAPPKHVSSDLMIVDFLSPRIAKRMRSFCTSLRYEDAQGLIQLCRTRPESSLLAAFIWESICRAVLRVDRPPSDAKAVGELRRMRQAVSTRSSESETTTFFDNTLTPGVQDPTIICATERGVISLDHFSPKLSFASPETTPASAVERLPLHPRVLQAYDETTLVDVSPDDTDKLFVPKATVGDNPLFDAFFFEVTRQGPGGSAVLWVFRFAAPQFKPRGDIDVDQIDPLAMLIGNARNAGYELAVKYVLVAPQREGVSVGWQLPRSLTEDASWSTTAAEVYAQYIDIGDNSTIWPTRFALADTYVPLALPSYYPFPSRRRSLFPSTVYVTSRSRLIKSFAGTRKLLLP